MRNRALRSNETPAYKFLMLLNLWANQNSLALLLRLSLMMHTEMPWFHRSFYWNETDLKACYLNFIVPDWNTCDICARLRTRVKKNPAVHIFTRCMPYFYTNNISPPSCILPLGDNKNGGTTFSLMVKADSFWTLDVGNQLFRCDIFADSSKADIQSK